MRWDIDIRIPILDGFILIVIAFALFKGWILLAIAMIVFAYAIWKLNKGVA